MKTKEFYESIAKEISFSKVEVNEEKKIVCFETRLAMLNKKEMSKIMELTENSIDFNVWTHKGFAIVIHF